MAGFAELTSAGDEHGGAAACLRGGRQTSDGNSDRSTRSFSDPDTTANDSGTGSGSCRGAGRVQFAGTSPRQPEAACLRGGRQTSDGSTTVSDSGTGSGSCRGAGRKQSASTSPSGADDAPEKVELAHEERPCPRLVTDGPRESKGSVLHPHGCTPCSFYCYSARGCRAGATCCYCHQSHVSKMLKRKPGLAAPAGGQAGPDAHQPRLPGAETREGSGDRAAPQRLHHGVWHAADAEPLPPPPWGARPRPPGLEPEPPAPRRPPCRPGPTARARGAWSQGHPAADEPPGAHLAGAPRRAPSWGGSAEPPGAAWGVPAGPPPGARAAARGTPGRGPRGSPDEPPGARAAAWGGGGPSPARVDTMRGLRGGGPDRPAEPPRPRAAAWDVPGVGGLPPELADLPHGVLSGGEGFFVYAPSKAVVVVDQFLEMCPPPDVVSPSTVFSISPDLPLGVVMDRRSGVVLGKPRSATGGPLKFFVTACRQCGPGGERELSVLVSALTIQVLDVQLHGHQEVSVRQPEPGVTVITLREGGALARHRPGAGGSWQ